MCFDPPDPPKVSTPVVDPSLARQRAQAEADQAEIKAANKQRRTENMLALLMGRVGRKSLFSGGQGGAGFQRSPGDPVGNVVNYQPGNHYQPQPVVSPGAPPPLPTGPSGPGIGGGRGWRGIRRVLTGNGMVTG